MSLCCVGLLGSAAAASAAQTLTTNVVYQGTSYPHIYSITVDPCSGSFTGTGSYDVYATNETISGTISNGTITGLATYDTGYAYSFTGTVVGGNFSGTGGSNAGQTFDSVAGTGATVPASKPGYGYGDKNHTHCGPPGLAK